MSEQAHGGLSHEPGAESLDLPFAGGGKVTAQERESETEELTRQALVVSEPLTRVTKDRAEAGVRRFLGEGRGEHAAHQCGGLYLRELG